MHNLLLNTDSYKLSHYLQYPEDTETLYSYIESRGGVYDEVVFFGLQMFLDRYFRTPITEMHVEEAAEVAKAHGVPFDKDGALRLVRDFKTPPLAIYGVPEGSVVPVSIPLVTVYNLGANTYQWVSYWETALLRAVWYPTTVATISFHARVAIAKALMETQGNLDGLDFKLHDFGARGVSSYESSEIGGLAHLAVGWKETDTLAAVLAARRYYQESMAGFSIPAAEHSTITSWGRENEVEAYRNMVKQFGDGLYAVVSDSYDIYHACRELWGRQLKDEVIERGGTLVVRPDSGDPKECIVKVLTLLDESFGSETNQNGYKVLNHVRVIYGDGINKDSLPEILDAVKSAGYCIGNVAFGMGAGLLQKLDRDTQKFAMKTCWRVTKDGTGVPVFKQPVEAKDKVSKSGIPIAVKKGGKWDWVDISDGSPAKLDNYEMYYHNDGMSNWKIPRDNLQLIRDRVNQRLMEKINEGTES